MQKTGTLAVMALVLGTAIAHADAMKTPKSDRDFFTFGPVEVPTPEKPSVSAKGCTVPSEPVVETPEDRPWGVHPDQAQFLLRAIYQRQRNEKIVASDSCSCESFFGPYEEAIREYEKVIANTPIKDWEQVEWASDQRRNELTSDVRKICKKAGVL